MKAPGAHPWPQLDPGPQWGHLLPLRVGELGETGAGAPAGPLRATEDAAHPTPVLGRQLLADRPIIPGPQSWVCCEQAWVSVERVRGISCRVDGGSVSRTPATPPPERHPSSSQTAQWAVASRRRGCPWQREPQAGRGQTRWAHSLKAKAEPGWGPHEPEAWGGGRAPTAAPSPQASLLFARAGPSLWSVPHTSGPRSPQQKPPSWAPVFSSLYPY